MSRRRTQKKRSVMPDPVYDSRLVELIVRQIMRKGKKSLAYKIMYETMTQIAETTQQDPLVVIEQAIRNATPLVEVKARRVGQLRSQIHVQLFVVLFYNNLINKGSKDYLFSKTKDYG